MLVNGVGVKSCMEFVYSVIVILLLVMGLAACEPSGVVRAGLDRGVEEVLPVRLGIGETVPDYRFVNHEGGGFIMSDLRPRVVIVTFIFTRCAAMEFCPRMVQKFVMLREILDGASLAGEVELLSITLDPAYDTPEVLARYAGLVGARPGSWTFATCSVEALEEVLEGFGVFSEVSGETGVIEHNLVTALIDSQGRLQRVWEGNRWSAEDIIAELPDGMGVGAGHFNFEENPGS